MGFKDVDTICKVWIVCQNRGIDTTAKAWNTVIGQKCIDSFGKSIN